MDSTNFRKSFSVESDANNVEQLHEIFIQNVSHELRTPVTIIYGYAELLNSGQLGELNLTQQRALNAIVENVDNLRKMVDKLDTLISAHAKSRVVMPVLMSDVVAAAIESTMDMIDAIGLELDIDLEPGLPLVEGDPYHLQAATECLLENSIKFNSEGGRIEVKLYSEGGHVCLAVEDSGIGMDSDEIHRILSNRFSQVDGSLTREYGGLGLGLTVVKAVVEEHDGLLEVMSEKSRGSKFIVKLPIRPITHNSDSGQWNNVSSHRHSREIKPSPMNNTGNVGEPGDNIPFVPMTAAAPGTIGQETLRN